MSIQPSNSCFCDSIYVDGEIIQRNSVRVWNSAPAQAYVNSLRTQNKPKPIAEAINNSNQRLSSGRTSLNSPFRVISPFNRRHARSTGKIPHTMSLFFRNHFLGNPLDIRRQNSLNLASHNGFVASIHIVCAHGQTFDVPGDI